jgi:hypothetical protein
MRQGVAAPPPIWLQGGFRLLFTLGALWAAVVVTLWVGALAGRWTLPTAMDPLAWHQHEMLFGYLGAVIGGFLSAAIPNWTGRRPVAGWPVAGAVGLWLAARLAILWSAAVPPIVGAALDVGFLLLLLAYAARQIFASGNRNKPILIVLALFALACGLDHAAAMGALGDTGLGMRMGFALVLLLISLIGGRIIPAFTRNWMMRQGLGEGLPVMANRFDMAVMAATALALGAWAAVPDGTAAAVLLLIAGAADGALVGVAGRSRSAGARAARLLRVVAGRLSAARLRNPAARRHPGIERDARIVSGGDGVDDAGGDDARDARPYRTAAGGRRLDGDHLSAGPHRRAAARDGAVAADRLSARDASGGRVVERGLPAVPAGLWANGAAARAGAFGLKGAPLPRVHPGRRVASIGP